MKNEAVTHEQIMSYLVELHELVLGMNRRMATKDDLEALRLGIREELRPFSAALDRDAETIITHEKRITVLERKIR